MVARESRSTGTVYLHETARSVCTVDRTASWGRITGGGVTEQGSVGVTACRSYYVYRVVATYIAPDSSKTFIIEVSSGGAGRRPGDYVGEHVWADESPWRVIDAWSPNSHSFPGKDLVPGDAVALKVEPL